MNFCAIQCNSSSRQRAFKTNWHKLIHSFHIGSDPNIKYTKLTQVPQILLTVDCDIWNGLQGPAQEIPASIYNEK